MAFENLFVRKKRYIGGVRLDAVIRESHSSPIRLTQNPVEKGADVTDHAIIEPKKLTIEGVVSDTPLGFRAVSDLIDTATGYFGASSSDSETRSQIAFNDLNKLKDARDEIEIQTGLKLYPNMMILDIKVDQDKDTSRAIFMTIECQEVIIVETEVVELSKDQLSGPIIPKAASEVKSGRREVQSVADDSKVKKSAFKQFVGWFQ